MIRAQILAELAWFIVSLWSRTIKIRFVNMEVPMRIAAEGEKIIYAFFHGNLFLLLYPLRSSGVVIPVSESRDGEIMSRLLRRFGFSVVRGSSKRNGHKALLSLISGMRTGKNVAVAVDGPREPLHEVKEGAVFLAGATKAPIIPVMVATKRFWVLKKSWDKLKIPVPFTTGYILYGEPIYVNSTSHEDIHTARRKIETDMQRLTLQAQGSFRDDPGWYNG